ncbi:MAG: aminotransferase class I/II-fold pyridoxal phosphate-dependent enzyme [Planctomycetes bacterium]|jgi:arginine/lysine/ornithine decarboxylase|nr:aminotransferase class I/II-fold pyridoxal phosphate-dependent enzyme [Planctomycetota bacterium]
MTDRQPLNAPLYEQILRFVDRHQAPFYSPGHKGGRTLPREFRERVCELDLNNLPDTDTLHCPTAGIQAAQQLLAAAYGVAHSYMLVGGSTAGNIAALLSTLSPGDSVLVQRNAHKSVIAGIVQVGAIPIWLPPAVEANFEIALGVSAAQVEQAFVRHPHARALLVLNPTYFGTTPDIRAIAQLCRAHGKLLLVDEAHGPHFHFHPELPTAAEDVGADAVVQSTHKILSGLSQAAVLHTGAALDQGRVQKCLQLIQSTSPNFAIMASIDLARLQMVTEGRALLDRTLQLAREARDGLAAIPGVEVLSPAHRLGAGSGFRELDETKVLIGTRGLGISGRELQTRLNRDFGVQPELGGSCHALCIMTIGNTAADVVRLVDAMRTVAEGCRGRRLPDLAAGARALLAIEPEVVMSPREAFFAPAATLSTDAARGRICAEVVTPYPPGIPALMPGERITGAVLAELRAVHAAGCPISAADPSFATVRVVA